MYIWIIKLYIVALLCSTTYTWKYLASFNLFTECHRRLVYSLLSPESAWLLQSASENAVIGSLWLFTGYNPCVHLSVCLFSLLETGAAWKRCKMKRVEIKRNCSNVDASDYSVHKITWPRGAAYHHVSFTSVPIRSFTSSMVIRRGWYMVADSASNKPSYTV